jgi:hypothetical protein
MNIPSIKSIMQIKDVTIEQAKQVRAVLELESIDAVTKVNNAALKYVQTCYNRPPLQMVKLTAIDTILQTYGVEGVPRGHGANSPGFDYCNTGDSYASTIIWINGRYRVANWGDIAERGNYE